MGAKICRPVLAQHGAEVKHKWYAEPLNLISYLSEALEDWKTSLFKD